jgi:glutathione S-transferase
VNEIRCCKKTLENGRCRSEDQVVHQLCLSLSVPRLCVRSNLTDASVGAYRAHIALAELNVPYDEEIIDLTKPRTPEYLKVNPRGQVPTMEFDGETITESAIVSTFLADAFPSTLWPASTDPNGPLVRSKINFFADAYFSKVQSYWGKVLAAKTGDEEKAAADAYADAVSREVEPLLADAAPFFGGSNKLTLAEVGPCMDLLLVGMSR